MLREHPRKSTSFLLAMVLFTFLPIFGGLLANGLAWFFGCTPSWDSIGYVPPITAESCSSKGMIITNLLGRSPILLFLTIPLGIPLIIVASAWGTVDIFRSVKKEDAPTASSPEMPVPTITERMIAYAKTLILILAFMAIPVILVVGFIVYQTKFSSDAKANQSKQEEMIAHMDARKAYAEVVVSSDERCKEEALYQNSRISDDIQLVNDVAYLSKTQGDYAIVKRINIAGTWRCIVAVVENIDKGKLKMHSVEFRDLADPSSTSYSSPDRTGYEFVAERETRSGFEEYGDPSGTFTDGPFDEYMRYFAY